MGRPTDRCGRCCKEATWIRKTAPTMNRDEGATYYVTFACGGRNVDASRNVLVVKYYESYVYS